MMYKVNEIFYSIQGEGLYAGTPMNFIRLSGCNLNCKFCDTKHQDFAEMGVDQILEHLNYDCMRVCITGGEPLTQDLEELTHGLKMGGFRIHLETNGTIVMSNTWTYFNWITVSPKSILDKVVCDEIKILCGDQLPEWPEIAHWANRRRQSTQRLLQPIHTMSKTDNEKNIKTAIDFVLSNPGWRLSLQLHKIIGVR